MESYRVYWTNISSSKVLVIPSEEDNKVIDDIDRDTDTVKTKVMMDRSDILGDYELVSDDDYYDMMGSDTRTVSDRQQFQGFTVLPISENVIQNQDNPDQTDGDSHDTANEKESIDPGKVTHEISEEQTTKVPTRLYKGKSSQKPRKRPSILMTPPVRTRNRKVSSTSGTTTTKSTTATSISTSTVKVLSSPSTTTTTKVLKTTSKVLTTTSKVPTTSSKVSTSKSATVKVKGGIIVNARSSTSRPIILEPKFIFTTESSTEPTTKPTASINIETTSRIETSTEETLTTMRERGSTPEKTEMFSHVFSLTSSESEESDQVWADSQTEVVIHTIASGSDGVEVVYNVGPEVTTEDTVPTYDDLEVIYKENITTNTTTTSAPLLTTTTTKGSLSSDLYEVKYNENATETILMGEVTELERMPRDNLDNLEPLEGAYKRLEAQYGGWEESAASEVRVPVLFILGSLTTVFLF